MDDPFANAEHLKGVRALLEGLREESPRGQVLISAALLEDQLTAIVRARLVEHPAVDKLTAGFNAPLGTLSAKSVACLALGVISEREFYELELIRKVRNAFAHRLDASFGDVGIADQCRALQFSAKPPASEPGDPQALYMTASMGLILNFVNRAHYVGLERLKHTPWGY